MSKFFIINSVVLSLFALFMATNGFMQLTVLGYMVVGGLYLLSNLVVYFAIRLLRALEAKKTGAIASVAQ